MLASMVSIKLYLQAANSHKFGELQYLSLLYSIIKEIIKSVWPGIYRIISTTREVKGQVTMLAVVCRDYSYEIPEL